MNDMTESFLEVNHIFSVISLMSHWFSCRSSELYFPPVTFILHVKYNHTMTSCISCVLYELTELCYNVVT